MRPFRGLHGAIRLELSGACKFTRWTVGWRGELSSSKKTRSGAARVLAMIIGAAALSAHAYEGAVRRQVLDGGVHQPVLTKAPELIHAVQATYPEEAAKNGLTGEVHLELTIAADGSVSSAKVTRPAGHRFDEAALAAVAQFRFSAGEVDGSPAPIQIEYVYHFTLVAAPPAEAPAPRQGTLKGRLLAKGSRSMVGAASVRCANKDGEALTDRDGRFQLEAVAGECRLRVLAEGFKPYEGRVEVPSGGTLELTLHLEPRNETYETVVRAERETKEVTRQLQREELQKLPGSFGDPIRVLQSLPGVARAPFLSGQLIVRGATPSQTDTLMDGIPIPILYHLGGGPSVVNAEFLDRVDFYPGGFGARYGRAIGGIVDVATRKGAEDTLHGVIKVDPLDASAFVEAPIGDRVSVAAAARRSYLDLLLPLFLSRDSEGGTLQIVPRYWDYQVRADFGTRRGPDLQQGASTFYVMAFGSDDVLRVVATGGARSRDVTIDAHTLFHRVKGDWTYRRGALTSVFTPYFGFNLGSLGFGTAVAFKADDWSMGAREDLSLDLAPWLRLRAGADLVFDHLVGSAQLPLLAGTQYVSFPGAAAQVESQTLARTINSFDGAVYAESDFKLGRWTLTPGLRFTEAKIHSHDLRAVDPRFWARYRLADSTTLKSSVGLYSQAPNGTNFDDPPLGNPNLSFQRAFQTSIGVEQKFGSVWSADLVGYYNRRFDNLVSPGRILANPDGSVTRELFSNDGRGRAFGLELLLRHELTRNFFGWLAYTLGRSQTRRVDDTEPFRMSTFDETHILAVVASWRLGGNWELGGRFRYVSGRPFTPVTHPYDFYGVDANRFYPTTGDLRSARLPPFHQLDVRLQKDFLFRSWTLSLYLDVQNAYNARNPEATIYDYRYREPLYVPGIPVLPLLGVKGAF